MDSAHLHRWLRERNALIVKLVAAGTAACDKSGAAAIRSAVANFLDALVDYISAAHFDRFARLAEHGGAARALTRCYPQVARTTARLIGCHDLLAERSGAIPAEQMAEHLARIGMTLEDHFVLEDYVLRAVGEVRRAA